VLQEIAHTLAPENETLLSACIERRRSQWMISGPSSATSTASHSLSPEVGAFLASLEISHSTDQTGNNASSESAAAFFKERMQQQPKSKIEEDAGEDDAPATGEDPRDKLKADSDGRDLHRAFATVLFKSFLFFFSLLVTHLDILENTGACRRPFVVPVARRTITSACASQESAANARTN